MALRTFTFEVGITWSSIGNRVRKPRDFWGCFFA